MSADSSDHRPVRWFERWQQTVFGVVLWAIAYKLPQWLMADIVPFLLPILPVAGNVRLVILYVALELLTIAFVYIATRLIGWTRRDIGLGRFDPNHILLALGGYVVYFLCVAVVFVVVQSFNVNIDEEQALGFDAPATAEKLFIFMVLVGIVPFTEELLFRGFLFKALRTRLGFVVTSLVVSVLFALVHGQLAVGLDVFVLSLVACYLREKTGSLWPAFILHSFKNSVAFFILFIYNV